MTCQEYGKKLVRQNMLGGGIGADGQQGGGGLESLLLLDSSGDGNIKQCPMCHVPIERDAGCAQMMCKRCKHVFCWFCLKSLDVSFGLWSLGIKVSLLGDDSKSAILNFFTSSHCKKQPIHMRYHFFLHYGWFFQNLGIEAVRTFMHNTSINF